LHCTSIITSSKKLKNQCQSGTPVMALISPNSITPTLRQSPGQVPDIVADVSWTQIMKVRDTNHVMDFHDLCPRQSPRTLLPTFPVQCNRLNSIRATQTGLSRTLSQTSRHVEMVCVHDFHDLCRQLSPKLHGFMLCHRLCPRLS